MRLAAISTDMVFDVACELEYSVLFPSTLIIGVHAQQSASQTVLTEQFSVDPPVPVTEFTDEGTGNRLVRLTTDQQTRIAVRYAASVECDSQTYRAGAVQHTPVADLEVSTVPYLYPSRYCQSDQLGRLARRLFGSIQNPHEKAVAVADWIHDNVDYVQGSTTASTSAYDTVTQRTGVCRDFSHLGIALCRALNIPARYFAGYAYELQPPDFHACFECFIGGSWVVFDATRLAHLNGLVRVGTGRDAADASVASIFGSVACTAMRVSCALGQNQQFQPIDHNQLSQRGVSLEPTSETGTDAAAH